MGSVFSNFKAKGVESVQYSVTSRQKGLNGFCIQ